MPDRWRTARRRASDSLDAFGAAANRSVGGLGGLFEAAVQPMRDMSASVAAAADALDRYHLAQIRTAQDAVENGAKLGTISASQSIAQLKDLAAQEHEINLQRIADRRAVYAAQGNDTALGRTSQDAGDETERYTRQIADLNTKAAQETQAAWSKAFAPINRGFDTAIQGMVLGTQTFQQTVQRLGQSIAGEFVDQAVHMATGWVEQELIKTAATQTGNATRLASNSAAAALTGAEDASSAKSSVASHAWSAAAAVYDDVSQIPYVGWVLAPPAAAAAAAAVLGFGGNIPSAAGGWQVPSDTLAMVHEDERILPARYSAGLDRMVGAAADGGGTGGHTFNNTFHVQAGNGVSAAQLPDMIVRTLQRTVRNSPSLLR